MNSVNGHRLEAGRGEAGSAFVISILVLFLLSVLGMALLLTTTAEKEIAVNFRWGEQAFFNADAALEYGKNVLGSYMLTNGDFKDILPPARIDATVADASQPWGAAHPELTDACDPKTPGCRDYQYYVDHCPPGGGGPCVRVYIGKVLLRPDLTGKVQYDFRAPDGALPGDLDLDGTADIEGSYTVWVRRPIVGSGDYGADPANPLHDRVILTAEGTAPNAMGPGAGRPVSLRRLEMTVRRPTTGVEGDQYGRITGAGDRGTRQDAYDEVRSTGF